MLRPLAELVLDRAGGSASSCGSTQADVVSATLGRSDVNAIASTVTTNGAYVRRHG